MPKTLDFDRPHLLRNEEEYELALTEVRTLMLDSGLVPGTEESDRFDFLVLLIENYEDEHYPIGAPSPQAVVDFMLEQRWRLGRRRLAHGARVQSRAQAGHIDTSHGLRLPSGGEAMSTDRVPSSIVSSEDAAELDRLAHEIIRIVKTPKSSDMAVPAVVDWLGAILRSTKPDVEAMAREIETGPLYQLPERVRKVIHRYLGDGK